MKEEKFPAGRVFPGKGGAVFLGKGASVGGIIGALALTEPTDTVACSGQLGEQGAGGSMRLFNGTAMFLDLILEPDASEATIGNLAEQYPRRLAANPGHAKRWLIVQVSRIVYGRAMDVLGRFTKALAGK